MTGAVVVGAVVAGAAVAGTVGGVVVGVVVVLGLVGVVEIVTLAVYVVEVDVVGVVVVGRAVTLGPSGESTRLIVDDFGTPQLAIASAQTAHVATQIHGAETRLIHHPRAG